MPSVLRLRTFLYLVAFTLIMMAGSALAAPAASTSTGFTGALNDFGNRWSISEYKVGFLKHDVKDFVNPFSAREEDGLDLNAQILFQSPRFLRYIGSPRPAIGGTLSTSGDTSHAHADLNWQWDSSFGLFLGVSGGFAIHSGLDDNNKLDLNHEVDKRLGSRLLFHFAPEIGYRFDSGYGVSFYWEHLSNGQVLTDSDTNEGLDNVGVRFSYLISGSK